MTNKQVSLKLGKRIKKIRKEKMLTLDALAHLSGVSKGYLSRIEGGQNDPTYSILLKISRAMSISPSSIFDEEDVSSQYLITRVADRKRYVYKNDVREYIQWDLSGNIADKKMETQLLEIPFVDESIYEHDDERFFYLISGTVQCITGEILEEGDTIYISPNTPHCAVSVGEEVAKAIIVCCK